MDYSIFSGTMADMTYLQIEKQHEKLPVLFPIGVIEEHGPVCLGTDVGLHITWQRRTKRPSRLSVESIIAPAYYWGINAAMNGFAVHSETRDNGLCFVRSPKVFEKLEF